MCSTSSWEGRDRKRRICVNKMIWWQLTGRFPGRYFAVCKRYVCAACAALEKGLKRGVVQVVPVLGGIGGYPNPPLRPAPKLAKLEPGYSNGPAGGPRALSTTAAVINVAGESEATEGNFIIKMCWNR